MNASEKTHEYKDNAASATMVGLVLTAIKLFASPIEKRSYSPAVFMVDAWQKIHASAIQDGKEISVIWEYVTIVSTENASDLATVIAFMDGKGSIVLKE